MREIFVKVTALLAAVALIGSTAAVVFGGIRGESAVILLAVALWVTAIALIAALYAHTLDKAELKQAGKSAESSARIENERSAFVANISHDLRTPLTSISGFAAGILDGTIPPEKQNNYLRIIADESSRLTRMVETLMDIGRLESGEANLVITDFNFSETVRRTVISLGQAIDGRNLQIEFDNSDDLFVSADEDVIHKVVYNLLDNAVKFSDEGGTIGISLTRTGGKARFAVSNGGAGIPPDELPLIFGQFYKSDRSRGLDRRGKGLGLFICKAALAAHGEEISADLANGITEFKFLLPLAKK